MLKISEMAKLAGTTRRTLIFYDEQAIFQPIQKTSAGYRYYDYDQLYDLKLILGLRNIGLPLDKIKAINRDSGPTLTSELVKTQAKIDDQIKTLQRIQNFVTQKIDNSQATTDATLYQPTVAYRHKTNFWCSRKTVSCTEEEIAELFAEFYNQLDSLTVLDTNTSGFLTDLELKHPEAYVDASFRIIKTPIAQSQQVFMPMLERAAGDYACILVENNTTGITRGLELLNNFCQKKDLTTQNHLWQLNEGELIQSGASKYGWLEFKVMT